MSTGLNAAQFVAMVLAVFPELREEFEWDEGLDTMQMGTLCRHAQRAIATESLEAVVRSFQIADTVLKSGDDSMRNAVHVSFLEHLDFRAANGGRAFKLLSPALHDGWLGINQYMEQLLGSKWQWKGPRGKRKGKAELKRGADAQKDARGSR